MVIIALDHVPHCFSQADGIVISDLLSSHMVAGGSVTLSFTGVEDVTSSFVNSSIVPLVEKHGSAFVKDRLRIICATHQVSDTIRRCVGNAERLLQVA
jgi:hypothetical protein